MKIIAELRDKDTNIALRTEEFNSIKELKRVIAKLNCNADAWKKSDWSPMRSIDDTVFSSR